MTTAFVGFRELLVDAQREGYAVAAINVIDVITMDGVLRAAAEQRAPVIVQAAARTARQWGPDVLAAAFARLCARYQARAILGLDHCSDTDLVGACLEAGFGTVLFDGSALPVVENIAATRQVVATAHARGAGVEGELESIRGTEVGVATGTGPLAPIEVSVDFIRQTGVDCFAPSIGNVHGRVDPAPRIDVVRAAEIALQGGRPLALHGGTGIDHANLRALIGAGVAKVNVSTALREAALGAMRETLPDRGDDPAPVLEAMRAAAGATARDVIASLGSAGRAR